MMFKKGTKMENIRNSERGIPFQAFILSVVMTFSFKADCQVDSIKLIFTAKIHVLLDRSLGVVDFDEIRKDTIYQTDFVNSVGFKDVVFLAIRVKDLPDISVDRSNQTPFSCEYLIAYSVRGNHLYHLKGFRDNNFARFYDEFLSVAVKSSKRRRGFDKSDIEEFTVEGLDFVCLYRTYILGRVDRQSCCVSCVERDSKYAVF